MDNITHTLTGLALAESGLKRRTPWATLTLMVAANLPDVDGLVYFGGSQVAGLSFRRGWTHGVLAMALLPLLLTGTLVAVARFLGPERKRPVASQVLVLAIVGVWSHPLLDLLNTYGVRLLMPFSPRWFYGDALFIVDPWVWLMLGAGCFFARRRPTMRGGPARFALGMVALYAVLMALGAQRAEAAARREASGLAASLTLASPVIANPFQRDVIRQIGHRYELGSAVLGRRWHYAATGELEDGRDLPGAATAAGTRDGATFLRWARFPLFESVRVGDRIRVTISDLRYRGGGNRSWASVTVYVSRPASALAEPRKGMRER